jgi:hypothetical protein
MRGASAPDYILNVEFPTEACVERANPSGYVAAECAEMIDVVVELAANALLVCFREFVGLGDCFVERLAWHAISLSRRLRKSTETERRRKP